jgi:hypothetical protein
MSVSQLEVGVRLAWWRRLCPSSFALAGITALIVWVAVAALLRQGRLAAVLSAGRAELAARGDAAGRTGLEGRPVPVEQDGGAGPPLLLLAEQLLEPFQAPD